MDEELMKRRRLRRLLEGMSRDIVAMSIYWKMNSIEGEHEWGYPTLQEQMEFTEQTLNTPTIKFIWALRNSAVAM